MPGGRPTLAELDAAAQLLVRRTLRDGVVELHKTAAPNLSRRYVFSVQPTLLGELAFERCWGRLGTTPRRPARKVRYYPDVTALLADRSAHGLMAQARRRCRRGYRMRGGNCN